MGDLKRAAEPSRWRDRRVRRDPAATDERWRSPRQGSTKADGYGLAAHGRSLLTIE
ncbi:hypothetical protein [Micromonospora sp. NBC_00858]|uniref:hypothetical protein n=1 Tax=Micromonospora sp. NBC_00858 TaxID=2975979 RepID=UPI003867BDE9|nr:hypothetical protein OG990_30255 [Micromonospora sp. NBC_00858]